jgi:hypothetical protein
MSSEESKNEEQKNELAKVRRVLPEWLHQGYDKIKAIDKDDAVRLWATLTGKAVEILRQRAQLIFRFDQEGWDIAALGNGHAHYYLKIAFGQMLPELFVQVVDPALLDRASKLTIPDQERVIRHEEVPVLIGFKEDGQPYVQSMNLAELAPRHAKDVMRGGKIQSEPEQIAYARSKQAKIPKTQSAKLVVNARRTGATATVGNIQLFFTRAEIDACSAQMKE